MAKKIGDHWDYGIRQWCLDSSIASNEKGVGADKILEDAQKFYGFVAAPGGEVKALPDKQKGKA